MRAGLFGARGFLSLTLLGAAPALGTLGAQQAVQQEQQPAAGAKASKLTLESVLRSRGCAGSAALARRQADHLHATLGRQAERPLGVVAVDHERRRLAQLASCVNGANARWSPDGTRIAYLAQGEPSGTQIFVRYMDGERPPTQITRLDRDASGRRVVAGRQVARVPHARAAAGRRAADRDAGRAEGREVDRGAARRHEAQLPARPPGLRRRRLPPALRRARRRRHAAPGHERRRASTARRSGRPTASRFVFIGAAAPRTPSTRGASRDIYAVGRRDRRRSASSRTARARTTTRRCRPTASSSRTPATTRRTRRGSDSKLYVMNADGSQPARAHRHARSLAAGADVGARRAAASTSTSRARAARNLYFAPLAGGAPRRSRRAAQMLARSSDIGRGDRGRRRCRRRRKPNDVVAFRPAQPDAEASSPTSTTTCSPARSSRRPRRSGTRRWTACAIQGWIVKPPGLRPGEEVPAHARRSTAARTRCTTSGFNFARQEHAANGYVVLYTNPRGSTGYGSAFGNAIKNAYPGQGLRRPDGGRRHGDRPRLRRHAATCSSTAAPAAAC